MALVKHVLFFHSKFFVPIHYVNTSTLFLLVIHCLYLGDFSYSHSISCRDAILSAVDPINKDGIASS